METKEEKGEKSASELLDHRKIGQEQKLFFFSPLSPGSCIFLPYGARIYNKLIEFLRQEYRARKYEEVVTPNMFNTDLWKSSGHYEFYKSNMFLFQVDKQEFALKPMNCPGHCLIFAHENRSYQDLPWRIADFGVLHRNEASGALTGLTRVRRFQQDDAHIFARTDQIESEVMGVLDFIEKVYGIFGFTFEAQLSTRPEKFIGNIKMWEVAENALTSCLKKLKREFSSEPDGAFYGPKIDIQLKDSLGRKQQCATIQLDFQLPERFKLEFTNAKGELESPVMIHRAILGSVERMIAILAESCQGKWPFWLSPRQVRVLSISGKKHGGYASNLCEQLVNFGYYADVDNSAERLSKKIALAQSERCNFMIVVGDSELKSGNLTVRSRDHNLSFIVSLDQLHKIFQVMTNQRQDVVKCQDDVTKLIQ